MRVALRIEIEGIVQGVGFRPFVHRLATELCLAGSVSNRTGGVTVVAEGDEAALGAFLTRLRADAPPAARVDAVEPHEHPVGGLDGFVIGGSVADGSGRIGMPADLATCPACLAEMRDPADRRFAYPFTNCTDCGPRFTIVRSVPYDRPRTTMAAFALCDECAGEYRDIGDRRYHAEPVACPLCGPSLSLLRNGSEEAHGSEALSLAREALAAGSVVAVKGLGGFHLACIATDQPAVTGLRERKHRWEKPLAVMFRDLAAVRERCVVGPEEERLLRGMEAPIVLCRRLAESDLAPEVAPDCATIGALLPYTPLHHLLFADAPFDALVMTSGNLAEEPLCTDNDEALGRLRDIADAFLLHDREIASACDDSVVLPSARGPIPIRRSRGWVPRAVRLAAEQARVLAVGAMLKSTFCLTRGADAYPSQHIGDLDDLAAVRFLEAQVERFVRCLDAQPEALACDLHPLYESTRWAVGRAAALGVPLLRVQHHHAHIASVLAEHGEAGPVVGVACDGTGYGSDGSIWGCEVLVADLAGFERAGHLLEVPLPGGEAAVREPWRMACEWLEVAGVDEPCGRLPHLAVHANEWAVLRAACASGLNSPLASSAGRLFDAIAVVLGIHAGRAAYEGQAAMRLEACAEPCDLELPFEVGYDGGADALLLDPRPTLAAILELLDRGESPPRLSDAFHRAFARALADAAARACLRSRTGAVALSGGTFQNRILLERLADLLERDGLRVLTHREVPPNDGGIALGQAAIAGTWLREGRVREE